MILSYKGGNCQTDTLHRQHHKLVDLSISTPACHGIGAEGIDIRLDKYIGKCCHRLLDCRRKADPDNLLKSATVCLHFRKNQTVSAICPE